MSWRARVAAGLTPRMLLGLTVAAFALRVVAGLATGVWPDADAFLASRTYAWFEPQTQVEQGFMGWQRAVRAALAWVADRKPES